MWIRMCLRGRVQVLLTEAGQQPDVVFGEA
jgi:hypothetical protein